MMQSAPARSSDRPSTSAACHASGSIHASTPSLHIPKFRRLTRTLLDALIFAFATSASRYPRPGTTGREGFAFGQQVRSSSGSSFASTA